MHLYISISQQKKERSDLPTKTWTDLGHGGQVA